MTASTYPSMQQSITASACSNTLQFITANSSSNWFIACSTYPSMHHLINCISIYPSMHHLIHCISIYPSMHHLIHCISIYPSMHQFTHGIFPISQHASVHSLHLLHSQHASVHYGSTVCAFMCYERRDSVCGACVEQGWVTWVDAWAGGAGVGAGCLVSQLEPSVDMGQSVEPGRGRSQWPSASKTTSNPDMTPTPIAAVAGVTVGWSDTHHPPSCSGWSHSRVEWYSSPP